MADSESEVAGGDEEVVDTEGEEEEEEEEEHIRKGTTQLESAVTPLYTALRTSGHSPGPVADAESQDWHEEVSTLYPVQHTQCLSVCVGLTLP